VVRSLLPPYVGVFVTLLAWSPTCLLASGENNQMLGTTRSPTAPVGTQNKTMSGTQAASFVYNNASYGTGGGALRNRGGTTIGVSGVTGPVQAAFLYWAVITDGPPDKSAYRVKLTRLLPTAEHKQHQESSASESDENGSSRIVRGKVVGSGPQPCWIGTTITVFRAEVPPSLANGNGLYQVTLKKGAAGSTDGADPWSEAVLPLWEGASLVIVGTGMGTVGIYDRPLSGNLIDVSFSYTLDLPVAANGVLTLWDNIGADGQSGVSRSADPFVSQETTTINGSLIAGPGSDYNDSDWNGSSGLPLPQLWDDTGHDITLAILPGATRLNITIDAPTDCVTTVANIVEVQ
jgi:hypothetical protein